MNRFPPQRLTALFAALSFAALFIPVASGQELGACGTTTAPLPLNNAVTVNQCKAGAIEAALKRSGAVQLALGDDCVIDRAIQLPASKSVIIDGAGVVLSPAGKHRVFQVNGRDIKTKHAAYLQNMSIVGGYAPRAARPIPPKSGLPHCSHGWKDGQAGAIYVRQHGLFLINVTMRDNHGAPLGPEAIGGAVAAFRSPRICVIGSTFTGNTASSGGAIGVIHSRIEVINSVFRNNSAVGEGGNKPCDPKCGTFNHNQQCGSGGISGCIYSDGFQAGDFRVSGTTFENCDANQLGGAISKTGNREGHLFQILKSTFKENSATNGSAIYGSEVFARVFGNTFEDNRAGYATVMFGSNKNVEGSLRLSGNTFKNNRANSANAVSVNVPGEITMKNNTVFGRASGACSVRKDKRCGNGFAFKAPSAAADKPIPETLADAFTRDHINDLRGICQLAKKHKVMVSGTFPDGSVLKSVNCP